MQACRSSRWIRIVLTAGFSSILNAGLGLAQSSVPSPWSAGDIGSPAVAGSSSFDQGQFTVIAGGADIWGQSDEFHFVYQQVSGDVDVIARVDSLTQVNHWAKMGVMIRSSLAANAAYGFALVSAGKGTAFQSRPSVGAGSANAYGPAAEAPYWVRLVRVDTDVTAYASADGKTWQTVDSATIALGTVAYVGLATTSHNASAVTTAKASAVAVQPLSLPSPQQATDIGNPAVAGSGAYSQGVYQQRAGGVDIWDTSDQFHFIYQPVDGDVEVIARVQSLGATDAWAKSGVMIRETLSADARHASAFATAGNGYAFQRRIDPGGYSEHTAGPSANTPGWVRLVRTGSQIDAYQSADGMNWTAMGSDAIPMAAAVYVGIATTSHNAPTATDAVVDNLSIKALSAAANNPPTVTLTAPANGATYTAPALVAITALAADIDGTIARVECYNGTTLLNSDTTAPYAFTWSSVPAGTYAIKAVAYDNNGASVSSATSTITVGAAPVGPPTGIVFQASPDHASLVTSYELRVFASGANPATATAVGTSDLAKPTPAANGDITVDRSAFFSALAVGNYLAAVRAIGSGGASANATIAFTR